MRPPHPRFPGLVSARLAALAAAVLSLSLGAVPAPAQQVDLADFAWLAGTWRGPGPEGAVAEIQYMSPEAGVLPAFFRLYRPDGVLVMEAVSLVREEDGLFMYVRHFDEALVPLEEDHAIRLHLTDRDGDTFVFENVREGENPTRTVITRSPDGFTARSELRRTDGTTDTIRVAYRHLPPGDDPGGGRRGPR